MGRIYEHMVSIRLSKNMVGKGFYTGIDYQIKNKTYDSGLMVVELQTYGSHPKRPKLKFNEADLDNAIARVSLELSKNLEIKDKDQLLADLRQLNNVKWAGLDSVGSLDSSSLGLKPYDNIRLKPLTPKKISITIAANNIDGQNLPLAWQLFRVLETNINERLANSLGLVESSGDIATGDCQIKLSSTLLASKEMDLEEVGNIIKDTAYNLGYTGALARLKNNLRLMSYSKAPALAVNFRAVYVDTKVAIGPKGWRKIANRKKLRRLLKQARFEIQSGKNKIDIEV